MPTYTGKVVSVSLDVDYPKHGGDGSYQAFILKYINNRNEVREIVKPMAGLKYKIPVRKTLDELKAGDVFTVVLEKNKAGYDDIVALTKGEPSVDTAAAAASASSVSRGNGVGPVSGSGGKVIGSTYETPEERKVKQRLIVRQAALNQALEFLSIAGDKKRVSMEEVPQLAAQFEAWVYRGIDSMEKE